MTTTAGTVKVGRWHYPALQDGDAVTRNTKRDGSGDWEETNPLLFRPVGEGDPAAEQVASQEVDLRGSMERHPAGKANGRVEKPSLAVVPPIDGFTAEEPTAEAAKAHGGKVGAQTKKPGKSTWEVGTKCPQGHVLEEGDIYVMPSGRKQCRQCRRGHASNRSGS